MRISEAGQDFNLWICLRLFSFCVWRWILCAGVGLWILPEEEFLPVFALRGFLYLKSLAIVTEFGIVERGTWITSAAPSFDHLPSIWAGDLNFGTYDHMSYLTIWARVLLVSERWDGNLRGAIFCDTDIWSRKYLKRGLTLASCSLPIETPYPPLPPSGLGMKIHREPLKICRNWKKK